MNSDAPNVVETEQGVIVLGTENQDHVSRQMRKDQKSLKGKSKTTFSD